VLVNWGCPKQLLGGDGGDGGGTSFQLGLKMPMRFKAQV